MVSQYWARRIEREYKEKMEEEFNREEALKKKAEVSYKLNKEKE